MSCSAVEHVPVPDGSPGAEFMRLKMSQDATPALSLKAVSTYRNVSPPSTESM